MIRKIGLTGNIGSGKTTVRKLIEKQGIAAIDADALAKALIQDDAALKRHIQQAFGADIYNASGILQPHQLAERAFKDEASILKLNAMVHPAVFEAVDEKIAQLEELGTELIVIEAALFFETGWEKDMSAMICVAADEAIRIARVQQRSGWSVEQIKTRMRFQIPEADKIRLADFVIHNNGDLSHLESEVNSLLENLK